MSAATTPSTRVSPRSVSEPAADAPERSRFQPSGAWFAQWAGLVWTLVRTDFKVRYHGTIMGFLWALLKPVMMLLVLMGVFSFIFASNPNYRLNLIVGLFLWDFFAEGTKVGLTSLHAKAYLLSKTRFPRWIVVVTSVSNAAITLGITSAGMLAILVLVGRAPSVLAVGLFLLYVSLFFLIVMGFSLGASVLFLRYRDLNQVWEVLVNAGFFVAPVIYPLSILPERFHFYLYLWPPTSVIQFSRAVLIDGFVPSFRAHLLLLGVTALILGTGIAVYRRYAATIAERL
ncbi:MAG: ABC transporter permease [Candidatus Rokuibacteriota bacterium]